MVKTEQGYRFDKKTVWVVGASGGLGQDIVFALVRERSFVIASARNIESNEQSHAYVSHINVDVRDAESVERASDLIAREHGRVDGLVISLTLPIFGDFLDLDDDAWTQVLDTKLMGTIRLIRSVAPIMIKQGAGSIVTLSGGGGVNPSLRHLPGSVANAGMNLVVKGLARRLGPTGVRVNAVSPGPIQSPRLEAIKRARGPNTSSYLGRAGLPADVTNAVLFLLSDEANYITGANLAVDGGGRLQDAQ